MARTPWAPGAAALASAARVVRAVLGGQSADAALGQGSRSGRADRPGDTRERSAAQAIALGTLRWYLRLWPALETLLEHPGRLNPATKALLAAAAHQVEYSRHAPEATVHAAVDATRLLNVARASGLVNAVMRRFVAERVGIFVKSDANLAVRSAHPEWLVERLRRAWEPPQVEALLAASNAPAPMTLRVDLSRVSAAQYAERLAAVEIGSSPTRWCPSAVVLDRPTTVARLPGFAEGLVSVQDAGAQLAAPLLDVRPGMRVLDACAAPGGKTGHLLELLGAQADVTAVDSDAERAKLISENLHRLSRSARVCVADLRGPGGFRDGRPYQRVLVDAPCSSTGVIRRHPDIKLLRRSTDIAAFAAAQLSIARAAVALLAPGGRLVYSTCSVLPEENEEVMAALLSLEPQMRLAVSRALDAVPGLLERRLGVQLLPGAEAGTDGFYYACLEKTTAGN